MKPQRMAFWLMVTLAGGVCLLYGGAWVIGRWASFALEQKFFGLSPRVVLAIDDFVVWGAVAFAVGAAVGMALPSRAIPAALVTCLVFVVAFLLDGLSNRLSIGEAFGLFAEPLLSSVVFVPLGTVLAARLLRPNTSLERTRER
jgi:hypothetical protein